MPEAVTMTAGEVYPASVAWDLKVTPTRWSSSDPGAATVAAVEQPPPAEGEEPRPDMKTDAIVTAVENTSPAVRSCEIRAHATVDDEESEFHGQELLASFLVTVIPIVGGDIALAAPLPPPPPPEGAVTQRRYRREQK